MILHPAKAEGVLLATGQKHQLLPLHLDLSLKDLDLSLKDSHVEQVHGHRHLGVIVDDEFGWRPPIVGTCGTVSKNLCLLSRLRHFVDTPRRELFCHARVPRYLACVSAVWDGCGGVLFDGLNSLHRRAARLMISGSSLSRFLGILPLKEKLCSIKQC